MGREGGRGGGFERLGQGELRGKGVYWVEYIVDGFHSDMTFTMLRRC